MGMEQALATPSPYLGSAFMAVADVAQLDF
jgi:hypothetical protein